MDKKVPSIILFTIIIMGQILAACSVETPVIEKAPSLPTNSTSPLQIVQSPTITVAQTSENTGTSTFPIISVPDFPTPQEKISSNIVQDGPFYFDTRFFRDATFGKNPVASSLYSDLEEIGIYWVWEYHGPELPPPVTIYWGVVPDIAEMLQQYQYKSNGIKDGDKNGWIGGAILPSGSKAGDQIKAVVEIKTTEKIYGTVLRFTLKNGERGLEPDEISVQALSTQ